MHMYVGIDVDIVRNFSKVLKEFVVDFPDGTSDYVGIDDAEMYFLYFFEYYHEHVNLMFVLFNQTFSK